VDEELAAIIQHRDIDLGLQIRARDGRRPVKLQRLVQNGPDLRFQLDGSLRELVAAMAANQKWVVQLITQALQGAADRRLAHVQLLRRSCHMPLFEQALEDDEKIEIEVARDHAEGFALSSGGTASKALRDGRYRKLHTIQFMNN
jgi:hypothetical protein